METNRHTRNTRAFTLLIAVILSSVALSIGAALAHVTKKQLALSMAAQDSVAAFYAASSALECVTAADQVNPLPVGGRGSVFANNPDDISVYCYGGDEWIRIVFTQAYTDETIGSVYTSSVWIDENGSDTDNDGWFPIGGGCAHLTATKNNNDGRTRLYARGTNTCDFSDETRVVERGVSAQY